MGGFEAWPSLDELFPTNFQGVNHNRWSGRGNYRYRPAALEQRLRAYFAAEKFPGGRRRCQRKLQQRAQGTTRKRVCLKLKDTGHFRKDAIVPLLIFPFDRRYIY